MWGTCLLVTVAAGLSGVSETPQFNSALPVWPEGRELEKNVSVGFRAVVTAPESGPVTLRLTASCIYRVYVNGAFVAHGPARAGHGFYRVDEWDIAPLLTDGPNVVAIEVAGYNANSYYLLDQPSFLQAEVVAGNQVIAATGDAGFETAILKERVQKVQRFSFQRPFIEVYRLAPGFDAWHTGADAFEATPCATFPEVPLLPRRVPYTRFAKRPAGWHVASGTAKAVQAKKPWKDRSLSQVGPDLAGFPEKELETVVSTDLQEIRSTITETINAPLAPDARLNLPANAFHIVDLGTNLSGFLGATVTCTEPCRLFLIFDEMLAGDDVNFRRMGCVQSVTYELQSGTYHLESFEPYTMRYIKALNLAGACTIEGVYLREYANPDVWEAQFACSDPRLNRLFDAGRETYVQNAVDVFMDCPSRERAGWLCDSFFTARTADSLSGNTLVEKNFIENYLLPPTFKHLPDGMLPMCYPSDHYNGNFIPNWAMWFVVELEEYAARSGDTEMVKALEPKVLKLFEYFEGFRNDDGLLQDLEAWVFVEWSAANKFVQDVNYPTNMLYAGALEAAANLYGREELRTQADAVRKAVSAQSYDGDFFVDNAVSKDGKLEVTRNRTEVCQYFAFFFGLASPESHPKLWRRLRDDFGPDRGDTGAFKEIHPANSFIGNMLRFELLSQYDECAQILDESVDYLLYMAERTGTLWENVHSNASCNHGFASHICHTLYRDVAGLYEVDPVNHHVTLRFTDLPLDWCEVRRPLPDGVAAIRWWKQDGAVHYTLDVPAGYTVDVQSAEGVGLVREP
ncbi:MAG: hypothetical protein GY851_18620 [bacterium]|nr:hypothetical protein [bacterium]